MEQGKLAEKNADKLREYVGKIAYVNGGKGPWGSGGAQIVDVKDNTLTLFAPAGHSSSTAFAVLVHCEDLRIVEMPVADCAIQLRVLACPLTTIYLGQIRKWEHRGTPLAAPRPRGGLAFHAEFGRVGSSNWRQISIYAPGEGNPDYTLVTLVDGKETAVLYGSNVEVSRKFAVTQVDYRAEGFRYIGRETGSSPDPLFVN